MTMKFEDGKTYSTRSVCNHDTVISITVLSRTAKTIKTTCGKTLRVSEYEGRETVKPWGTYSMSPTISAKPASAEKPVTSGDALVNADFEELFDIEERAALLGIASSILSSSPAPHNTAKIYDFASYRK